MERHCRGPDCLFKKEKDGRDQVRCSICVIWHHIDCVNVDKDEMHAIWTCFECRGLSKQVKSLEIELKEMKQNQKTLIDMLSNATKLFENECKLRAKAEEELKGIRTQLAELPQQIAKQHTELCQQMTDQFKVNQTTPPLAPPPGFAPLVPSAPPMQSLLIGTSLLRNVDQNKLDNWNVIAKSGASVDQLHREINGLAENKHYNEMVIVGGSIDLESKNVQDIVSDYQAMAVTASTKADKIKISSVLPRTDKELGEKTKTLNDELKSMCERDGHSFIDNDPVFHLMNGKTNEALLVDGLHLSKHGVDSLLLTCDVTKDKSAYTPTKYPKPQKPNTLLFRGHKHPLSNFYDVPLTINGKHFKSSEAAYQYRKAEAMGDHRAASKIMRSKTGLHAMKIGRKITTDGQWKNEKVKIMEEIIKEKLSVSDTVRDTLTQSGSKEIVEDTDHEFWGRGKTGNGQNRLGKTWMELRKKLKENPRFLERMNSSRRITKVHSPYVQPRQQRPLYKRPQTHNWATRDQQPRCYQCGETGHSLMQCRKEDIVTCWACGLGGHKQKHCGPYSRQSRSHTGHYSDSYDY